MEATIQSLWIINSALQIEKFYKIGFFQVVLKILKKEMLPLERNLTSWLEKSLLSVEWKDAYLYSKTPKLWGPIFWKMMYFIATIEVDKKLFFQFLVYLKKVLPCQTCARNYSQILKKLNFSRFEDKIKLIQYIQTQVRKHTNVY